MEVRIKYCKNGWHYPQKKFLCFWLSFYYLDWQGFEPYNFSTEKKAKKFLRKKIAKREKLLNQRAEEKYTNYEDIN